MKFHPKLVGHLVLFAKGMKCPSCSAYMWAESEDSQPQGSWVIYLCRNQTCKNRIKVFESK